MRDSRIEHDNMAAALHFPAAKLGPGPLGTSEQEDVRRQRFRQELQNDMQSFLAAQAQENPRLRRLRRRQSEVTTSIIDATRGGAGRSQANHQVESAENTGVSHARDNQRERLPYHSATQGHEQELRESQGNSHLPNMHSTTFPNGMWPSNQPSILPFGPSGPYAYSTPIPPIPENPPRWNAPWPDSRMHFERPYYDEFYRGNNIYAPSSGYGPDLRLMPPVNPYERNGYGDMRGLGYLNAGPPQNGFQPEQRNPQPRLDPREQQKRGFSTQMDSKSNQYAAALERQMAERRHAEDQERAFRRQPGYSLGGNPLIGEHTTSSVGVRARGLGNPLPPASAQPPDQSTRQRRTSKSEYLRDLENQIQQKRDRLESEKTFWKSQDEKKDREIAEYNPWGRAGAGAPLRKPDVVVDERLGQLGTSGFQQRQLVQLQNGLGASHVLQEGGNTFLDPGKSTTVGFAANPSTGPPLFASQQSPLPPIPGKEKSFQRGQRNIEGMSATEREELIRKQQIQQNHQEALRRQVAERDAEKARQAAERKAEEEREQARILKEQEELKLRYAKEQEEARKKEEEARLENEKKAAERAAEQERRERAFKEAHLAAQASKVGKRTMKSPVPTPETSNRVSAAPVRSESPPIPTLRNKGFGSNPDNVSAVPAEPAEPPPTFRTNSPPIPTLRGHATASNMAEESIHSIGPPATTPVAQEPDQQMVWAPKTERQPRTKSGGKEKEKLVVQNETSETKAVLDQLIAIQQELEREDRAIQSQLHSSDQVFSIDNTKQTVSQDLPTGHGITSSLRTTQTPEYSASDSIPPAKSEDNLSRHQASRRNSASKIHTRNKSQRFDSFQDKRPSSRDDGQMFAKPSILAQQRAYLEQQDKELRRLREGQNAFLVNENSAREMSPTVEQKGTEADNLVVSTAADRERRKLMIEQFLRDGEADERRTRARKADDRTYSADIDNALQSDSKLVFLRNGGRNGPIDQQNSKLQKDVTIQSRAEFGVSNDNRLGINDDDPASQVEIVEQRNEARLKGLAELQAARERRKCNGDESDIILSFLKREEKRRPRSGRLREREGSIPASSSTYKNLEIGRAGLSLFPNV
ncbi:uncharacterized protein SPPG_05390 [Spizellomyces punctatus DAOM BR117]|uniref:CCDC66 domain-containing protein n=1 Tax=Spizellomyces punctatus (strain DAOM BR117) TaxID=645134 RepID=A0A0L0HDP4_SPIPD|nr:uncharacterized protein SPPG_05390 [Spizellomyces punctatus DAOM BR117]KNC99131.1 hypothetical protein SPPG_05390 [Spizellomyces punctatus DAOM BR117]|eukprot:XP_016607171.1 hypothetical protein SPPG_05390 [Spizellomyces punctatus DAOM BR117]